MAKYIIVINMGMKSIRSIVYDMYGEKIATASRPIETYLDKERVTQDPDEWWEKARIVVRESINDIDSCNIAYLTVTASSSCLVCVDKDVRTLGKCIMVSDRRAVAEAQKISSIWDTKIEPSLMLPKALWVKKNKPDIYNKIYKLLSPNDFLIARMTGEFVTDIFNAQKFLYQDGKYPSGLLKKIGIDKKLLPRVLDVGTEVGCLEAKTAYEWGLPRNVKIMLTTYDAICGFFGSGVCDEGEASDASGTVTALRALSYRFDLNSSDKIFILPYRKWKMNIIGGSNNLGGGLIEWVKQCYYPNEAYPYEVMEKDAYDAGLGSGGVTFLPYLLGERMPIWDSNARGVFFGLERSHTRKEMTRAVFDSTGFIDLDMINAIEETGIKVKSIRLSGGLARVNLISQIKADVTGRDVMVLDDFETTAGGAAILALVGAGEYENIKEAVDSFVKIRMVIHPIKSNHKKYIELYRIYKDTYKNLVGLFAERSEIISKIYPKHEIRIANM